MDFRLSERHIRPAFRSPQPNISGVCVLLRNPASTLAKQALALERATTKLQLQIESARAGAQRRPERAAARLRVADAMAKNLAWCKEIRTALLPHLSTSAVLSIAAHGDSSGSTYPADRLFALLRRDWSGMPECEAEVQTLLTALREELPARLPKDANILVLGAGLGRLADELAMDHTRVFAVELSIPMLMSAAHLRLAPIEAFEISTRHARSGDDQAKPFLARGRDKGNCAAHLVLADATDLPFEDGWADLVISVYFTDVVPPRKLLPEVRRVLRPEGRFIHLGPLGYHFDDADDHLSAEELLVQVEGFGFSVNEPRWVTSTHECNQRSIYECRFHNLLFSADTVTEARLVPWAVARAPFL